MIQLLLWETLCFALFWTVFCRSVWLHNTTIISVRLAMLGLGIAALVGIGAPLYDWEPDNITFVIMAALVVFMVATGRYWRYGAPDISRGTGSPRFRRRSEDEAL